MSTHDKIIGNDTFPNVRSDLNAGLAAIASQQAGTGDPPGVIAYERQARTDLGLVRRRNAANTGWIIDGPLAETYVISRTSNTILGTANHGCAIIATSGGFTQTFTAAATLGDGWMCFYRVESGHTVTFDPNSTENIDGATTKAVVGPASGIIICTGTAFYTVGFSPSTAPVYRSAISGFLPSGMTGNATTAAMTVSGGQATNSIFDAVASISGNSSWDVSNGNAALGYQGGTTLPNSDTIHMFVCTGASGTTVFAHNGLTPTPPAGYNTSYRRIFSFNTTGAGAPIPYTALEVEGGALLAWLTTQTLDVNVTNQGASRIAYPLNVPTDIKVQPYVRANGNDNTADAIIFTSGDETDVAPSAAASSGGGFYNGAAPGWDIGIIPGLGIVAVTQTPILTTDTSGQIGARATAANLNFSLVTRGFRDFRR